jgi:transposase-like protein
MSGPSKRKGSCERQNNKGLRRSYDSNFKLIVIREAEKNNCAAARKFITTENNVRRWRQQKDELSNAHSTGMAFRGPKQREVL